MNLYKIELGRDISGNLVDLITANIILCLQWMSMELYSRVEIECQEKVIKWISI